MWRIKNANPVISYKNLRRLIGILGMLLPVICYLGGRLFANLPLEKSISFYYYTNVRDALVGLLVGVGMFLISYNGYEKIDSLISKVTGLAAVGIALFPCLGEIPSLGKVGYFQLDPSISNIFHVASASIFFVLLALNSIFIFTLTDDKARMTKSKKIRNSIYIFCGIIILISIIALLIIQATVSQNIIDEKCIVFIVETIMLEAFGISWLVKGETIFTD